MIDVALLTENRYLNPKRKNWYINNILLEDQLIQKELEALKVSSSRVSWDSNPNLDNYKLVVFRTTWNYFEKLPLFIKFLETWKGRASFINSYHQIIWNLDKKYLLELHGRGINIPKTILIKRGDNCSLQDVCFSNKWTEVVIKPAVSAAAFETYHIKKNQLSFGERVLKTLIKKHDMIIQPFQKNILKSGEVSMMMIGGKFSHAVLKKAKTGDFRVQDDFGGTVDDYVASQEEIRFSEYIIECLEFEPIYARVDIILDNKNNLALSELELIEPEMWFRFNPNSAKKLGKEIGKRLLN